MSSESSLVNETIECPLCLGEGELKRAEVLDRLGVKDYARVAQLSAEEAFRMLLAKQKQDEQNMWARFEAELAKQASDIAERHRDELHALGARIRELEGAAKVCDQQNAVVVQRVRSELETKLRSEELEKERANRRAEDHQREIEQLREHGRSLEAELSKVARVGKREEVDFAAEARMWVGICISEKLPRNGDFILAYRDHSGAP